jgi:dephospho-CoA kinase
VLLIALTGNIASGKSEVARIFADLGATVIDADELAREAVRPGTPAMDAIVSRWGRRVLSPDGSLKRSAMRSIIFSSETERLALNAIVHPEVKRLRDELVAEARARGDAVVVSAIPLLYEVGLEKEFDRVILVDAPDDVRLSRLVTRRGLNAAEARRMMAAQMPASEKRPRAHFVIDNELDLKALRRAVERVWLDLTAEAAKSTTVLPPQRNRQ